MPVFLTALLPILSEVLGRVLPDPQAQQKAIADILAQAQQMDLAQLEVNKAEAANSSVFVAGWRPFIGWVCGAALAYTYVFLPLAVYVASYFSEAAVTRLLNAPKLDENLWVLLGSMLGLGGLRTLEKVKGVAR